LSDYQSGMLLISKSMLGLIAPVLTYTVDEIIEYAPAIFKDEMKSVFDLEYAELPEIASSFEDENILLIREKFSNQLLK